METDGKLTPEYKKKKKKRKQQTGTVKWPAPQSFTARPRFVYFSFYQKARLTSLSKLKTTKRVESVSLSLLTCAAQHAVIG